MSIHEVEVFEIFRNTKDWVTARDVEEASGITGRTVRHHLSRLARLGILETAAVYGGFRYRLSRNPDKVYLDRLNEARKIFRVGN